MSEHYSSFTLKNIIAADVDRRNTAEEKHQRVADEERDNGRDRTNLAVAGKAGDGFCEDEVDLVLQILQERDVELTTQTWNRRYREYMDKIKTGSAFEVAEVLRDLYLLRGDKDLSYGERKMLDTAMGLLVKEISLARKVEEDAVVAQIEQIFC